MSNAHLHVAIATATVLSAVILNLRPPTLTLSWNQSSGRQRSFTIVLLFSGACALAAVFGDDTPILWPAVYTMIAVGARLLMRHLESQRSAWSNGRVLGITRMLGIALTMGICWSCRQYQEILAALSVISGIMHARLLRAEHMELSMIFRDLQTRLATLEASQRGFSAKDQNTKIGDNQRRAG